MAHRVVRGLQWARFAEKAPFGTPRGKGAKALGLRYERLLAKALPSAVHGAWFEFQDSNGRGFCQPDLLTQLGETLVVLEAKYSWVPEGQTQIEYLYKPVLEKVYEKRVIGIVVCKTLRPGVIGRIVSTLDDALSSALNGEVTVLHWQAVGALMRTSHPPALPLVRSYV